MKSILKAKKGFILLETIIVMSVLALGLISLYGSYVAIIKNNSTSNKETTKVTYLAYQINKYKFLTTSGYSVSNKYYVEVFKNGNSYSARDCGLNGSNVGTCGSASGISAEDSNMFNVLNIEKIYFISKPINNVLNKQVLLTFDGSTIKYFQSIKNDEDVLMTSNQTVIVKTNNNGKGSSFSIYQAGW